MNKLRLAASLAAVLLMAACSSSDIRVEDLRLEMQDDPIAIGVAQPRFSWQLEADAEDILQTAYRIEVARSEKDLKAGNLLWDSGEVTSGESLLIPYGGPALESRATYYWRVKVTTNQGETPWSETAQWSMALLDPTEWSAQWIGIEGATNPGEELGIEGSKTSVPTRLAARYLRKEFPIKGEVKRARLYIAGLGSSDVYLNGKRVSEDVFAPIPGVYPKTTYYCTYDLSDRLQNGDNALGVVLGNGRFFPMRNPGIRGYGLPRLLAQLEIEYTDGTTETIVSDPSWQATARGPIVANNEFDGEEYDARLELTGWDQPGYDASAWQQPDTMSAPGGRLTALPTPNMRVMEEISPVKISRLPDGKFILDMGQNMVGWLKVNLNGKKDQPITFRFAELVQSDSSLYVANLRSAKVTDIYTPAADGAFEWEPRFVYHGFRFVEISGLDEQPSLESFTGRVIYDDMETIGKFETSNPVINQVYKNAYWGIRGNYRGFPTDCPQRDERLGWLGDRTTGAYGESFIFGNALLYNKWLQDIEDSQSETGSISDVSPRAWTLYQDDVTWPAAYFTVANMLYRQFGDLSGIVRHYPSMKRWVDHVSATQLKDYVYQKEQYGDWCMPPESLELIHSQDPARKTSDKLLNSAYFHYLLELMQEFAVLSGHTADTTHYRQLADSVKMAYNATFFNPETAQYDNNTVTANLVSLMLGMVPEGYEEKVMENIVSKTEGEHKSHVSTGVLGIQHLMRGLTAYGHEDLAYTIATNETYPSWGYMASKGATTIWELWNGDYAAPNMNSCNHVMLLGDLIIWYYENLAGIKNDPSSIGFKKIQMAPTFPEGLEWVKASYDSPYGEIKSHWELKNGLFDWKIEIPANTTASVRIPAAFGIDADQVKQLKGVHQVNVADDYLTLEIGSGEYHFASAAR